MAAPDQTITISFFVILKMHNNSSYTTDLHDLGGKPINVWVADSCVPEMLGIWKVSNVGGTRALKLLFSSILHAAYRKQEAQLMLTNLRDAFGGQSRSPNIVPFHMLGIVSYCAIVTLSLRHAFFTIFDFKKCCDLEMGSKVTQGH